MLRTGMRADLVVHSVRDPAHLTSHAGVAHARIVIRAGAVALHRPDADLPIC
jgi:imidazolonepropionase-like amidohydrolase